MLAAEVLTRIASVAPPDKTSQAPAARNLQMSPDYTGSPFYPEELARNEAARMWKLPRPTMTATSSPLIESGTRQARAGSISATGQGCLL